MTATFVAWKSDLDRRSSTHRTTDKVRTLCGVRIPASYAVACLWWSDEGERECARCSRADKVES